MDIDVDCKKSLHQAAQNGDEAVVQRLLDATGYEAVVRQLRAATSLPLWVKLTPNTGDLPEVARAAERAGADALVVANTILALEFDLDANFVTSTVFLSTLASPFTLTPLLAYLQRL